MEFLQLVQTGSQHVREPSPKTPTQQLKIVVILRKINQIWRFSVLIDKRHLDLSKEVGYNIKKAPEFLYEHC